PEMGKYQRTRGPLRFLLALANVRLGVWLPKPKFLGDFARYSPKRGRRIPGLSYLLLHEMFGLTHARDRFAYVTDGGHYDNLGLVELLRKDRQCDLVWCIDASGDQIDTFSTLGGALAMAETELHVSVQMDPVQAMAPPDSKSRFVRS